MRAITVIPGQRGSVALTDMPEPPAEDGPILVQTQAIGICGTDLEIINGEYGSAPPGRTASSSGMNRWAGWPRRPRGPDSAPGTWWSASSAGVTRFPARRARRGTGICA